MSGAIGSIVDSISGKNREAEAAQEASRIGQAAAREAGDINLAAIDESQGLTQAGFDEARGLSQAGFDEASALTGASYDEAGNVITDQSALAQSRLDPYTQTDSLDAQRASLGLGGAAAQEKYFADVEASPYQKWLNKKNEKAIMRNAAASGGLMSPDTYQALLQNNSQFNMQAADDRYNKLQGLTNRSYDANLNRVNLDTQLGSNLSSNLIQLGGQQAAYRLGGSQQAANYATGLSDRMAGYEMQGANAASNALLGQATQQQSGILGAAKARSDRAKGELDLGFKVGSAIFGGGV